MKPSLLLILLFAAGAAAGAQNPSNPPAAPANPQANVAAPAGTPAKPEAAEDIVVDPDTIPARLADVRCKSSKPCVFKAPPGVPPSDVSVGSLFAFYYQDIKIGTGDQAIANERYTFHYTGWVAADGTKFDSTYDHRRPIKNKDGKPVKDADGKPKLGDPEPFTFLEGEGRVIPGLDVGIQGMRVGGKRRIIVPYQMAYGKRGRPSANPARPGVPPKADLIFDVDLLKVVDEDHPKKTPSSAPDASKPTTPAAPATPATPAAPATQQPK